MRERVRATGHEVVGYDISADVLAQAREGVDTGRFGVRGAVERGKLGDLAEWAYAP